VWAYLAGRIGHAIGVTMLLVVLVAAISALLYNVPVPWATLPIILLVLAVAAASFSALGLAVAGVMPNADAAPAIVNAIVFPTLFVSNVFIQMDNAPDWVNKISYVLPVRHFADAMLELYQGGAATAGVPWTALGVIGLWGIAGVALALRYFSWEPRR
jgi:ABC-2 type transport system permease protein